MPRGRNTNADRAALQKLKQFKERSPSLDDDEQLQELQALLASLNDTPAIPSRNVRTSLKGPEQQKLANLVKMLNNDEAPDVQLTEPMILRAFIKAALPILEQAIGDMYDYFWQDKGSEIVRLQIAPEGYIEDRLVEMMRQGLQSDDSEDDDVSFEE